MIFKWEADIEPIKRKSCAADTIKSISSKNVLRALQSISSMYVIWAIYDIFATQVKWTMVIYFTEKKNLGKFIREGEHIRRNMVLDTAISLNFFQSNVSTTQIQYFHLQSAYIMSCSFLSNYRKNSMFWDR